MKTKCLIAIALFSLLLVIAMPAAAQSAADLYKSKCAACHGADGSKSMMGAKPLNGAEAQAMSDAQITEEIANGKGKMPSYKGKLTDAQIKDLVGYIRTLKK